MYRQEVVTFGRWFTKSEIPQATFCSTYVYW